ncbi:hypothetical protein J6590_105075, partial [Homalodisca vitripennis]
AQMNDKGWTVQKRLLSARRASQMAVFDNEIERWGEVDVPYLLLNILYGYREGAAVHADASLTQVESRETGVEQMFRALACTSSLKWDVSE